MNIKQFVLIILGCVLLINLDFYFGSLNSKCDQRHSLLKVNEYLIITGMLLTLHLINNIIYNIFKMLKRKELTYLVTKLIDKVFLSINLVWIIIGAVILFKNNLDCIGNVRYVDYALARWVLILHGFLTTNFDMKYASKLKYKQLKVIVKSERKDPPVATN